ncbi:uncharacterized protein VTP21DRAFT_9816 [Calcarisporiella thermophila]|uniref:uncharacterized protein n=1 Tax=Calcarisporiella thermophila TaxID=911321 RepID=UPI00374360D1
MPETSIKSTGDEMVQIPNSRLVASLLSTRTAADSTSSPPTSPSYSWHRNSQPLPPSPTHSNFYGPFNITTSDLASSSRENLTSSFHPTVDDSASSLDSPFSLEVWHRAKDHNLVKGLPTFEQVITRKTRPPLTYDDFYRFMMHYGEEEHLNFLRDVSEHAKLWRGYEARSRRNRRMQMRLEQQMREQERRGSGAAGSPPLSLAASRNLPSRGSQHPSEHSSRLGDLSLSIVSEDASEGDDGQFHEVSLELFDDPIRPPSTYDWHLAATEELTSPLDPNDPIDIPNSRKFPQLSPPPTQGVSLEDVRVSALRIYHRYFAPRFFDDRFRIPEEHRAAVQELIEIHRRVEPAVFEATREYVHDLLAAHYYPRFLDVVCTANITPAHAKFAFACGCFLLTLGFAVAIAFILLNHWSRPARLWSILPSFGGWLCLVTGMTQFQPVLTLLKRYEVKVLRVRGLGEPSVWRQHKRLAWKYFGLVLGMTLLFSLVFYAIPGYRLASARQTV